MARNWQDLEGAIEKFLAFSKDEVAAEMRKTVVPERFAMVLARPKAPSAARSAAVRTEEGRCPAGVASYVLTSPYERVLHP